MPAYNRSLAGSAVVGALAAVLVVSWVRPTAAQQDVEKPAPPPAAAAMMLPAYRYQLVPIGERYFAIIDTQTGHTWSGSGYNNTLTDHGLPPDREKP